MLISETPVSSEGLLDVTALLSKSCEGKESHLQFIGLKQGDILSTPRFQMEKTMSAFEVMDKKMDIRLHAREAMTPKRGLKAGVIKLAKDLTLPEVNSIMHNSVADWDNGRDDDKIRSMDVWWIYRTNSVFVPLYFGRRII